MREVIVRLTSDHIKVKGAEYVQDLVRCAECKYYENEWCYWRDEYTEPEYFCSYGEVRDEQ